jgi:FAD/FMN-containing dehydrogenase
VICSALAERLRQDGLAFPTAHCGTVPISGYLLGGGVGLNTTAWSQGMSVFAVIGVDIVTADGTLRHASTTENPDLFWAVRGGGPGLFGVVTRFELQCYDAPGVIFGATYTFRQSDFVAVAKAVDEIMPKLSKDVEVLYFSTKGPDDLVAQCSGPACDQLVYIDANAFVADKEEGRRKLAPLTSHAIITRAIAREENREGSYDRYFSDNELAFPQTRWMGDDVWVDDPVAAATILAKHIPDCPSPHGTPLLLYIGKHDQPDAACQARGRYYLAYYLEWEHDDEEAANRAYALRVFKDLKPVANGSYINEMNQEGRPEDIHTCYTPEAWQKLADLRTRWDPGQVFHGFYGQS